MLSFHSYKSTLSLVTLFILWPNFGYSGGKKAQKISQPPSAVYLGSGQGSSPTPADPLRLDLFEKDGGQGLLLESDLIIEKTLEQATQYLEIKKKGRNSFAANIFFQECIKNEYDNPFCGLDEYSSDQKKGRSRKKKVWSPKVNASLVKKAMLIGNTDFFKPLSEPQIHRSFKEVKKFDLLAPLVKNVLSPKECPQATLAVALALRTEHFFPDESAQEQAIQLYERAITCDVKAPVSFKARFRLTLLYLWKKRPIDALPHLKVLTENPEYSEYHSRALYWGYDASKQTKDMDRAELYKSALLKRYPFSLHSILIWQDEALSKGNKNIEFDFSEPLLKMRSKSIPELNAPVRAVEALLFLDEVEAAKKILAPFEEEFEDAEVGFQLYAGLLYNRVGDFLNKFRILSNLFKTHPEMVSKASLTLFYPTKSLTAFSEVGFKLDPYLVLALIRQESAFNEKARSPAGAMGLMQLMPRTAYLVSRVKKNSLFNPDINVKVGSKYFSDLIDRFNGDVELALASYNAGPLRVDDWLSRYPADQRLLFLDLIPFQETREYVAAIARNYFWYHTLYIEGQSKTVEKPLFKVFDTSI